MCVTVSKCHASTQHMLFYICVFLKKKKCNLEKVEVTMSFKKVLHQAPPPATSYWIVFILFKKLALNISPCIERPAPCDSYHLQNVIYIRWEYLQRSFYQTYSVELKKKCDIKNRYYSEDLHDWCFKKNISPLTIIKCN